MATAKKAAKKAAKKPATKKAAKSAATKKGAPKKKAAASAKKSPAKSTRATTPKKSTPKKSTPKKSTSKKSAQKSTPKKSPAKKATVTKAVKKAIKSPFGNKFVGEMKERLITERAKYLHSAEEYRLEADALIEGREPGDVQFDEESGEGDTLAVERERDLALSNQARAAVEQIDAALDRIAAGTYGVCTTSGLSIPQERLRAIPWAAQRVEYKVGGLGRR